MILDERCKFCYTMRMEEYTQKLIAELRQKANDYEMMVTLREQGWTLQRIADKYGMTRSRVQQIVGKKDKPK